MDLKILEIASHTENKKALSNPTHSSKNRNRICGDEMEISLIVKKNIIEDMAYQCNSCVYCQASVSLLSRMIKHRNTDEFKDFFHVAENMFDDDKLALNKNWKEFSEIFDKKNIARKECLLLPLRTVLKALEI
jgi:nitrogen fixation NifU-like protein